MGRFLTALFLVAWASTASAQTITISDYQQTHAPVVQRVAGTNAAPVTFDGTYTGTAPASIYIQIVDFVTNTTVVQSWIQCPSPTISGGVWSNCTISVPVHATWEAAEAGENSSSPSIISGFTPTAWGVGANFLIIGDSLSGYYASKFTGSGDPALNSYGREWCTNASSLNAGAKACNNLGTMINGWSVTTASNTSSGYRALLATIQPALNMPIGLFNSAYNSSALNTSVGTSTTQWTNFCSGATCGPWGNMVANLALAGLTDFEGVIWYQGGQDSRQSSPPTVATSTTALQSLYSHLLALTSRTAAQLPMFIGQLGPETATSGYNSGFSNMRSALQQCPQNLPAPTYNCVFSSSAIDLNPDSADGIHPNAVDYRHTGFRDGQTFLNYYGLSGGSYSGAGPFISSATYSGSTVTLTVNTNGATGLVNSSGSTTAGTLNGIVVTDTGGATISSYAFSQPNKVVVTMNQAVVAPVTISYMQGENPAGCTASGSVAQCPNQVYGNSLPGADTFGPPLLPSIGVLTASPSGGGTSHNLTLLGVGQ